MAHVFCFIEGRELWMDIFLSDLLKRRYPYTMMTGQLGFVQPNPREIKLFDISLPEESIPYLLKDLAPFANKKEFGGDSFLKEKADLLSKALLFGSGLKPFSDIPISDTKWIKVPLIGKLVNRYIKIFKKYKLPDYEYNGELRHAWINVYPIGWGEDSKDSKSPMFYLPKGGEKV